jgi:hypothetical protein
MISQISTIGAYRTAAASSVTLGVYGFPLYLHPPPWALPLYVLGLAIVAWALSADDEVLRRTGLLAGLALVAAGAVSALAGGVATYVLG